MTRGIFDRELRDIQAQVLALGSEVEEHIIKAVDAFLKRDLIVAQRLIASDRAVNEQYITISQKCFLLIATQQPMAGDMRFLAAVVAIVNELERIHDYIKGISKSSVILGSEPVQLPLYQEKLPEMAEMVREMLRGALDAFARADATYAREVPAGDDAVDDLFLELYTAVVKYAMANPEEIERANRLEWAIHNLERAADRTINICEWVIYMAEGTYKELDSEFEAPPVISD